MDNATPTIHFETPISMPGCTIWRHSALSAYSYMCRILQIDVKWFSAIKP